MKLYSREDYTNKFTMISSRKKKFLLYDIYSKTINSYFDNMIISFKTKKIDGLFKLLLLFKSQIEILIFYMLEGRFVPSIPKDPKDKLALRPKPEKPTMSVDMLKYLNKLPVKLDKPKPLHLPDIMIFFKALEVFVLRRQWIIKLEELNLGEFSKVATSIFDTLPKLLLVIGNAPEAERKILLDFLFSIVVIYRQFKVGSTPNTESIKSVYSGSPIKELLKQEFNDIKLKEWVHTLGIRVTDVNTLRLSIYSGNASSPNSGASATKIIEDAAAVRLDPKLRESIVGLARAIPKSEHFIYLAEILWENVWDINDAIHSKLFHFTAKGGKARIIANVDWMTQTALSAFHFYFYKVLVNIKSDFTFDHKKGLQYIWDSKAQGDNFYSIDLSAATDRMPRLLQSRLLCAIANALGLDGEVIATHWLNIMDRSYSTKNSAINNGQPIIYSVGQGMGIFTSWPIMSLLHHYIVNGICGISTDNYALVGDDLVIRGKREDFNAYLKILQSIGMEVNLKKTIESEEISEGHKHNIEFARNYIIDGVKIDPIRFGILYAWNDEKTSFESFFYAMRNTLNSFIIKELATEFLFELDTYTLLSISYFFWKYKIIEFSKEITITSVFSPLKVPKWFDKIDFSRLHDAITLKGSDPVLPQSSGRTDIETFMHTFESDLVVRTKLDAAKARDLAERINYLRFIDDEIGSMALQISKRLHSVELIRYDIDEFGNPLISKRARKLIREITNYYTVTETKTDTESDSAA